MNEQPTESRATTDEGASDELRARLAQVRHERTRLQMERDQKDEAAQLARELEAEEQALRDERALDLAIAEHGPLDTHVASVPTKLGAIIVKRPGALRFRRFQDEGAFETKAVLKLVMPCIVSPSVARVEEMLDEQPGVLMRLANAVAKLAGVQADESAKKS